MSPSSSFRRDINGLRALALLGVLIFHLDSSWLVGGFAGVDVFFVISGFLMTKIIINGLSSERFSFKLFYQSRARRIIPPLALLCLVVLVYGWFSLLNTEYSTLGKHTFSSLLFYSNHSYWMEAGYFDGGSLEKWLLHTWSLSAEWQFYILYPMVVWLCAKCFGLRTVRWFILIGAILSLLLSVIASPIWSDAAYFLLPTRAWQMLAGGIAFLFPVFISQRFRPFLSYLGVAIIALSYFVFDKTVAWPGYAAMVPVIGAYLVIQAESSKNILLCNPVFDRIGLWSYSIYLWHWPIIVYLNNQAFNIQSTHLLMAAVVSFLLGALSYFSVERRGRKGFHILLFVVTLAGAFFVMKQGANPSDYRATSMDPTNSFVQRYVGYQDNKFGCMVSKFELKYGHYGVEDGCVDLSSTGGMFLWGDSYMGALSMGIVKRYSHVNRVFSSGCPPSFTIKQGNVSRLRRACDAANALAYEYIETIVPEVVVITNKHEHEKLDWDNTVSALYRLGVKHVIVVGPVPQWYPSLPLIYAKHYVGEEFIPTNKLDPGLAFTNARMKAISSEVPGLIYVDVLAELCTPDISLCKVRVGEELMAWDYGHLTVEGSDYVFDRLIKPVILESGYSE
ncbi:acyltransferase family protein [Alteromonas sp. KUL49]|uniref:acyltransferase family protein n=1 Tax=Alteromonas sp. KUL49 TaxID=2480798 RepID=UPI00102ED863|nr:acyltransferase family protein [Alteromonas sp. KUL49]TAP41449.1 acyltransferase [Alteromonas sp. KUL49]GEA10526.1 acyltransferase [Alteromonas sp. KUL49]